MFLACWPGVYSEVRKGNVTHGASSSPGYRMFDLLSNENSPRPFKNKVIYILILKATKTVTWTLAHPALTEEEIIKRLRTKPPVTIVIVFTLHEKVESFECSRIPSHFLYICFFFPPRLERHKFSIRLAALNVACAHSRGTDAFYAGDEFNGKH